jgi:NCS2 family nucleobase:cation symporter-2
MSSKPKDIIYSIDERPPWGVVILVSLQHIFLMSSTLVLPVVLITEIGGTFEQVRSVVALTMIACGLGTILQALRCGWFGSGFVCPNLCGPNFFAASMEAAWLGGLPLLRGMTIVAGLVEAVFARFVGRLKFLFPPEVTGLVVFMVAVGLVPLGLSKFLGIEYEGESIEPSTLAVAATTLAIMIGLNIWSKSLRLYAVLIGLATGYGLSSAFGLINISSLRQAVDAPWIASPFLEGLPNLAFDWSLVPVFAIVSITGALKSFGNLIMCEKINDDRWTSPDMSRISGGLMADAACVTASGLLGGMASDTSASNVSLTRASGVTSRIIGYSAGLLFVLLGFSPLISGFLAVMPPPVMGAILLYVTSFMMVAGIQIIWSSGLDMRKTFVVSIPLIFGLGLAWFPSAVLSLPVGLRAFADSPLTLTTVLAVVLHQILRISSSSKNTP